MSQNSLNLEIQRCWRCCWFSVGSVQNQDPIEGRREHIMKGGGVHRGVPYICMGIYTFVDIHVYVSA